jgi:hypothetical protein
VSEHLSRRRVAGDRRETERVNQPGREEGLVRLDEEPIEHERPEDWGWHGSTGKAGRFGAVIAILFTFAYLWGNHEGRVEDIWIVAIGLLMILILVIDWRRRKNAWRSE